ncbi:MAG TPA: IS4 family transposase [Roseimicrobium sp.]|nr:IS4 family transposase [Roseimicrobium sp.]
MRHENSVFHALLKQVPWAAFERLSAAYKADHRVRHLTTKTQLIALLYGQFSGAVSLREIVGGMGSHALRLYHLGAKPVTRSTLADANAQRPSAVFSGLFAEMAARAHRGLRRTLGEAVYLIDATSVRLSPLASDWAGLSARTCGAKVHVIYDAGAEQPIYAAVTPARVNDMTAAQTMPIEAGATYVFDLGYYDYRWWASLHKAGCRIITRFKSHTPLTVTANLPVPQEASNILGDRIGLLPQRQAGRRKNPLDTPVREIRVRIETGKILRLLSNDLQAPAQEIADLYKRRWAIELFFRWVKQTLKIRHFIGNTENAVRIQIAVALIAFLLLRMTHRAQKAVQSPLAFARLIRVNLMHRKTIQELPKPVPKPPDDTRQWTLQWI